MIGWWFVVLEYYSVEDIKHWMFTATDFLHPGAFSAFQLGRHCFCHTVARCTTTVRSVWLMNSYFKCNLAVSSLISKVTEIGMIINKIITPV